MAKYTPHKDVSEGGSPEFIERAHLNHGHERIQGLGDDHLCNVSGSFPTQGNLEDFIYVEPPAYMRQTFSGAQPANANNYAESDRVRNSFRSGALWSLKKLPTNMKSGQVVLRRLENTKNNLAAVPRVMHVAELGPLSSRAEKYVGTSYDKVNTLNKLDVDEKKFCIEYFSRKPFSIPVGSRKQAADGFINPDFGPGGGIDDEIILRKPKDSEFIAGPFYKCVPPQASEVPRSEAKRFVKSLYKQLTTDWSHLMFSVKLTNEEIVIKFPTVSQTLPPENALQKYMKRQAAHGDPQSWGLRKRGDRWGTIEIPTPSDESTSISSVLHEQTQAREPLLTFSFFLPWVTTGLGIATKSAKNAQRTHVRLEKQKKIDEERRIENLFQHEKNEHKAKLSNLNRQRGRARSSVSNISLDELAKRRMGRKGSEAGRAPS